MENKEEKQGEIFINGKGQVVKMLQFLTSKERNRLLDNIRHRNPTLARELIQESSTFEDFKNATDDEILSILGEINPTILGLGLKGESEDFQRRILSLVPRSYAEKAFEILNNTITNENQAMKRAKIKMLGAFIQLRKSKSFI